MCQSILSYFKKVANGEVSADGQKVIRQALDHGLISKSGAARHLGVQDGQITKIAGNLKSRDVRKFCERVLELN